jgi:cytochrome bd ubiquinol oxidase subunit I
MHYFEPVGLARWQFAITTLYHFIFVPLTIGLAPIVAGFQTAWYKTGNERWLRLTKFFGKLFLINFAIGVVTGIVQEFQFGMNWSEYSRYVGDVFGAPLAMEALGAFFVESTFLGLWIFGWDRLPKKLHLACIWLAAIAVNVSAFFIMAANSWMQHPVGTEFNPATGRAELTSIGALFTNSVFIWAFPHTITASFVVAAGFVLGISVWWMVRLARTRNDDAIVLARDTYRPAIIVSSLILLVAGAALVVSGDNLGRVLYQVQPAKMSAAEGLCVGQESVPFTPIAIGRPGATCEELLRPVEIPGVASFLATRHFSGPMSALPGVNDVVADWQAAGLNYNNYDSMMPPLQTTFWSFRLMIGLGIFAAILALWALWSVRAGRITDNRWLSTFAKITLPMAFLASLLGWVFTEVGRQPWIVYPTPDSNIAMQTASGVSRVVPGGMVLFSMIAFTLLYGVLAFVWYRLMHRYTVAGVPLVHDESPEQRLQDGYAAEEAANQPLSFAY